MPIPYERLKNALLTEQANLTKQLADLDVTAVEEGVGYSSHPADDGSAAFDQARDLTMLLSARKTLEQIADALTRFDNGTYGLCTNCGREIDAARLKAIPYTALCLECQARLEFRV
jgi:RNA polymerase-binding protein DksA